MTTPNMQRQFVSGGVEGDGPNGQGITGWGFPGTSLTSLYKTRGAIDLNESRLPNADDITVRPQDSIVPYNTFLVSSNGVNAPAGVTGTVALNAGDYLLFIGGDPTVPANWRGVVNTPEPPVSANPGQPTRWVRVLSENDEFFP